MIIRRMINSVGTSLQNILHFRLLRNRFVIDDSWFSKNRSGHLLKVETPKFLIDKKIIQDRSMVLSRSLANYFPKWEVAYSFKTNYEVAKLGIIKKLGITAEVVSGYEYDLARKLGYAGSNIIFNGPYKKDDELLRAVRDGAMVNLDTWRQIDQMIGLKHKINKKKIEVGIRVRGQIQGLGLSRFGYFLEDGEALSVIKKLAKEGIEVVGFHRHIGTDIYFPYMYQQSAFQLGNFMHTLPSKYLRKIKYINMGGGFPGHGLPPFHLSETVSEVRPIRDYIEAIHRGFEASKLTMKLIRIIVEPGRYFVGDAVMWVVTVLEVKRELSRQIILTDGALTHLPLKYYCPQIVRGYDVVTGGESGGGQTDTTVYGSTCKEDDILFEGKFPTVGRGDKLVFYGVGAYNQSMSTGFIFNVPVCDTLVIS